MSKKPAVRDLMRAFNTSLNESDRGCLLVTLADIDDALRQLLELALSGPKGSEHDADWLLDPVPGNRPLASLAVRTRMASCLGLIDDDTRKQIDGMRSLRNVHAHGVEPFEFTEENLQPLVAIMPEERSQALSLFHSRTTTPNFPWPRTLFMYFGVIIMFALRVKITTQRKLNAKSEAKSRATDE